MSEPSWPEVIRGAIERSLDGVHTAIPAKVTEYTAPLQQCKLAPVIAGMPPLEDVPVLWPRGGGYFVHLPLAADDHVLCVFCEQDFNPWRLSGSATAPALLRRHGLFAYAIPGAAPDLSPLLSPLIYEGATLGLEGGNVVHVTPNAIELGTFPALQPVALGPLVDGLLSALNTWLSTHTHTSAAPGSPTSPPIVPPTPPTPTGSAVVKCTS